MASFDLPSCFKPVLSDVDLHNSTEFDNVTANDYVKSEVEIFGLGTVTGIAIILIADIIFDHNFQYNNSYNLVLLKRTVTNKLNAKNILRTLLLTLIILLLPLVLVLLIFASFYKMLCSVLIKMNDQEFVEYLDSFDVFWSLEDDTSKSIINVVAIVESDSPQTLSNSIKDKLQDIYEKDEVRKIFFRRRENCGFYYWNRNSQVDTSKYVQVLEIPDKEELIVDDLEKCMIDLQNLSLPCDGEGLFKIIVTKQRVSGYNDERGEYGVIFLIHHSVGDGVGLIELLCQAFADEEHILSFPDSGYKDTSRNWIDMIQKLCCIPICFVDGIIRKPDTNLLHGSKLLGTKVFKWTQSEDLLDIVKDIKDNVGYLNFTDILLTALSKGLRNFFEEKATPVSEDIAVILPIRFPKSSNENDTKKLKNDFSVTILDVPLGENNLNRISERCANMRKSADPLTNYYFLKLVCSCLPSRVLKLLLASSQATMVFSNLPGPKTLTICGGNVLKSLVFYVPHKGTTGLGVTALCYGGVLRFAAMADTALVSGAEELDIILDGMVEEIRRLHRVYGDRYSPASQPFNM